MAGNFLTEHNFSPSWTRLRPHQGQAPHTEETRRHITADTLARFLHAFGAHHEGGESSAQTGHPIRVHPLFDLIEGPEDYKIYGELPGLASDDVQVEVNDHLFTVSITGEFKVPSEIAALQETVPVTHRDVAGLGIKVEEPKEPAEPAAVAEGNKKPEETAATEKEKTKGEKKPEKVKYHIEERKLGRFKREFQFPVELVVMESVKAQCQHGLLTITVPKHSTPPEERKKARLLEVD